MNVFTALLPLLAAQGAATVLPACDRAKAEQGIQQEMNICAHRDYLIADRKLNAQWTITAAKMKAQDRASDLPEWDERPGFFDTLLEAQRAWLKYRDNHCAAEGYWARGGSLEPLLVSTCKRHLTEKRTEELRALADWPD